jgi:hypothetical protein
MMSGRMTGNRSESRDSVEGGVVMTRPDGPEAPGFVGDLAQLHAALRVNSGFFDDVGLTSLPAAVRDSVRENLEFLIGRAIVEHCDDEQLEKLEREVAINGTLEALRWLYSATTDGFHDAIRAELRRLVDDLRGRFPRDTDGVGRIRDHAARAASPQQWTAARPGRTPAQKHGYA